MNEDVNVKHKITATKDQEGKFKIDSSIDLIPKEVVEELMNMAAEATTKELANSDAKEFTEKFLSNALHKNLCTEVLIWKILACLSLGFIGRLIAKLKGWL